MTLIWIGCAAIALSLMGCEDPPPPPKPPQGPPRAAGPVTAGGAPTMGTLPQSTKTEERYLTAMVAATAADETDTEGQSIFNVIKRRATQCATNVACLEETQQALLNFEFNAEEVNSLIEIAEGDAAPRIRLEAIRALGMRRIKSASSTLMKAIEDPNEAIVIESIRSLGDLRDPESLSALTEMTAKTQPIAIQREAIIAIGRYQSDEAVTILTSIPTDDSVEKKRWLVFALGQTRLQKAFNSLDKFARDKKSNARTRTEAVTALATLGNRSLVINSLKKIAANDADKDVRMLAQKSIAELSAMPSKDREAPTPAPTAPAPK